MTYLLRSPVDVEKMFPLFSCSKMSSRRLVTIRRSMSGIRATTRSIENYSVQFFSNITPVCSRHFATTDAVGIGETWPKRRNSKENKWNRAIAEADKYLGYPSILLAKDALLGVHPMDISRQLRKIFGTSHPLLKITKDSVYNGRQNMQVRGLITLLWTKGIWQPEYERDEVLVKKEGHISTIIELSHLGLTIHSGIVDIEKVFSDEDVELGRVRHANKLSVIIGDLLCAKANLLIGKLEDPQVAEDFSEAIIDFTESEFMLESDKHGQAVPTEKTTFKTWEIINFKRECSLLANSLKAVHTINKLSANSSANAYNFGTYFCFAWKASQDVQTYAKGHSNEPLNLMSLPVILHMEKDPRLLELVTPHSDDLSKVDYKKIRELMNNGPAVEEARYKCTEYIQDAKPHLQELPQSRAKEIMQNILLAHEV